jgi:hypothetical protein
MAESGISPELAQRPAVKETPKPTSPSPEGQASQALGTQVSQFRESGTPSRDVLEKLATENKTNVGERIRGWFPENAESAFKSAAEAHAITNTLEARMEEPIRKKNLAREWARSFTQERRMLPRAIATGLIALNLTGGEVFAQEQEPTPLTLEQTQEVQNVTGLSPEEQKNYDIEIPVEQIKMANILST